MAEGEILVSGGEESENGGYILDRLPSWMPDDPSSGNFKLLDVVGRAFDRLEGDIGDLERATSVQDAETVDQLQAHANILQTPPKNNEPLEKYRTRTIAEYQTLTTEATISDLLQNVATLLEIDTTKIDYSELSENGVVQLSIPGSSLSNLSLSDSEFTDIIGKHSSAGFRVELSKKGTFTYITPSMYGNSNHDAQLGYDGLDAEGNPKDNGGTYAGII